MFSSTPSSTSAFGSPLLFGQTRNSNAKPFGSQNMFAQSSSTNLSGPNSTSAGGTSMGLFGSVQGTASSPITWGSSSASMSSSTNGFGSRVGFGQSVNPNVSSTSSSGSGYTFGQGSNLFGSATNNSGTPMGIFGGSTSSQSSNLFGSPPNNGGTSTGGLFGQNSNLFGSASGNGGTSPGVFGGTSLGQSSNVFGSVPNNGGTSTGLFGQTASSSSFGQSSNLFGSASSNGGTSAGVFGGTSFGQSSNVFGSVPNNGGTSAGLFGQTASSSSFGQSNNIFGSVPNNGGTSAGVFGQTASSSSFGQRNNIFGSVPNNGGTSAGVFGQTASGSSFGQKSNIFGSGPNNGGTSAGVFGQTTTSSSFGQKSNIFGSDPSNGGTSAGVFGQTTPSSSFGQRSNIFGSVPNSGGTSTGLFGTTTSMGVFGVTVPAPSASIATSSSPILWSSFIGSTTFSQVPASSASSSSGSGSGCMTSSAQTTVPWFRTNLPGTNAFSFATQSSFSGNQVKAPIFGPSDKSSFGEKRGSRVTSYTITTTKDDKGAQNFLVSISAMPAYQNKSHEELRWEDHDQSNAGGGGAVPVSVQSNDSRNPFATKDSLFPSSITPSVPSNQFPKLVTPPSNGQYSFLNPEPPSVPSNPSSTTVTLPSIGQYSILHPALPSVTSNPSATTVTLPSIGQYPFLNPVPPSVPSNQIFTIGTTPPLDAAQPPVISPSPFLNNTCPAPSTSVTQPVSRIGGQTTLAQMSPSQNTELNQSPIANPFGTPSTVPQMSTGGTRTALPVRYGISCIPVCDKPAPARSPSLLNIRHLSYHKQRWLPIQKYKPKSDGPKVAFFDDAQKTPTTPKKEAPLLPRSNPRAFISGLYEELNPRANFNNTSYEKKTSTDTHENGEVKLLSASDQDVKVNQDKDGISCETDAPEHNCSIDSVRGNLPIKKEISSNLYDLMPKLKHSDYFFEPQVEELAIKESYEPGFCSHVKGFVVGRRGYGSITFLEETDVRELDLESYIEFRNREVVVYMDESKKPPVGQGLNKAAEITLCNIKVVDKRTGKQYVNGPNVDKLKEKLMKKTAEQGAEFVSYNPVRGEWTFRVQHF